MNYCGGGEKYAWEIFWRCDVDRNFSPANFSFTLIFSVCEDQLRS